ncbi:MAG TPA: hypothetical protein VHC22_19310 [Pirellulales bacterium]|nr:hypothetical protein [Pirellulales bacterium]
MIRFVAACIFCGILLLPFQLLAADTCKAGASKAKSGDYEGAMKLWEMAALDSSPKEKLRADINCLRFSRIAVGDNAIVEWMVNRAEERLPPAQLYAGMLYASGFGVAKNVDLARKWMKQADMNGNPDAAFLLKILDEPTDTGPQQ